MKQIRFLLKATPSLLLSGDAPSFVFRHSFANWHRLTKTSSQLQISNSNPGRKTRPCTHMYDGYDSHSCTPVTTHLLLRVLIITLDLSPLIFKDNSADWPHSSVTIG
jgi:hypothetical protein